MQTDIAEFEILDMGTEDVCGLYEIIWRFNTVWPGEAIGMKYQLADEIFRRLLDQHAVRVVRQRLDKQPLQYEPIPGEEMDALLKNPSSWYPCLPSDPDGQIGFETTDIGEKRCRELYGKTKKL